MDNLNDSKDLYETVSYLVSQEIKNMGLLTGHIRIGEVKAILSQNKLSVCVDGSSLEQEIRCNPDSTFTVGDRVWVHLINGDSKNKFIFSRIG